MKIQSNEACETLMKIADALEKSSASNPDFNMDDYRAVVASVLETVTDEEVRAEVLHHVDF
jgi:hypothetical protein